MELNYKILEMNKVLNYKVLGVALVLLGIFYIIYWDNLPPRTPYKIARVQSGLKLPGTLELSEFIDEWSFNGDGLILIVFKLKQEQELEILNELKTQKYSELPITNRFKESFLFTDGFISEKDIGYFRIREYNWGVEITILNKTKHSLIVFKNIF